MATLQTDVLVIGGGSTGVGVARDAAMRGFSTVLVDRGDLATGTTGRFHGLLHSGGRYVVKDPKAVEGCRAASIPVEEIPVAEALRRDPRINPSISRAFVVPDASVDSWKTVWACARSAQAYGGRILPYHEVMDLTVEGGAVRGALVKDRRGGEDVRIDADYVVNASGAWAGRIAAMAGCDVTVLPGKGIMIAMNHRLVNTVVNRCEMPADGDIIVPIRTVSV